MTSRTDKDLELEIEGETFRVRLDQLSSDRATVTVNGEKYEVAIRDPDKPVAAQPGPAVEAATAPPPVSPAPRSVSAAPSSSSAAKNTLNALMPGVVVRLVVEEGREVAAGQVLLVLEAMKMENEIRSDRSGTVSKIHVAVGQQVQTGEALVSFS